ncbi:MAG TPA: tetratricopeptide repeat protein [Pyrinomonadaceae bacterium]|nr:tetratricopeptide repeat protein [Pyrinomonadaceae bacterium]
MLGSTIPQTVSPDNRFMNRQLTKIIRSWLCGGLLLVTLLATIHTCQVVAQAQGEDAFSDSAADPMKLFERGQNAHARGDFAKALEFYDEALKLRPEFPEAEFQRANALTSLDRAKEAEVSFRKVIEVRKEWALPHAALGTLLVRLNRDTEAEPLLRRAIQLESQNSLALRVLADIRLRAGDAKEALRLATAATADQNAPVATWLLRAQAERRGGDNAAALISLDHLLKLEPQNIFALLERAETRTAVGHLPGAVADLKIAEALIKDDKSSSSRLAAAYQLVGQPEEASRVAQAAGLLKPESASGVGGIKVIGTPEEIEAANSDDPLVARAALENLLKKNPDNPMLSARLGDSYRTADPDRALEFFRRATKLQPANADYATGYSSALVQARRFPEAVDILRRVIKFAPDNYVAHANLATALYRLKQFPEALVEYQWLLKAKPDLTVAHYFIATAHDYLGEYEAALSAYELFLARADANTNQLEIDKVQLRLPSLRRQIKLGQGAKRKPGKST